MNRYKYICIEGNIGTGKTTLTKILSRIWNAYPIFEQFTDNPFLPLFYKDPERYGFQVELFFMTERHKQLENIKPRQDIFQQAYIADYFFQKTLLFASHTLKSEEYKLFLTLFDALKTQAPQPDIIVYLHRSIPTLSRQIKERNREMEAQINDDYLQQVQDAYFNYFRGITHFPVLILDIGQLDFQNDPKHLKQILDYIDQPYLPGVHRVQL